MFIGVKASVMNLLPMTDLAIAEEMGSRFRALRLKKNITIEELANRSMLSESTIKSLEKGQAKLSTMIAVLRELHELNNLNFFIEEQSIEPMLLLKLKGKQRVRASKAKLFKKDKGKPSW
jgi:transcriptional regulator with XRE-family HTH domain